MDTYSKYIGQLLDNRYQIKSLLGNGGMSLVFLAYDTILNREVALKILKDTIASDELAVKRFVNESTAISMLKHENIVSVYDISVKSEIKYIVMECVKGISLKKHIEDKGILPFSETVSIAIQVLSALSHAHSKGIIHRDIKPQNIMIYENGVVKVADFGIAKVPGSETISLYDKAIGTVNYINPEQACGRKIDSRSDIYSLGAMLYEMVTGQIPFKAETPIATAYMQIHEKPVKPSEINENVPKGLEQIILKAMKKSPENRFQTANEMLSCLERLTDNLSEITFDFVFDDEAEKEPFKDDEPQEISEVFVKTVNNTADENKSTALSSRVRKIDRTNKKKKPKVEIEEVVIHKKSKVSLLCIILGIITAVMCVCLVVVMYVFENYILKSLNSSDSVTITVGDYLYQTYSEEMLDQLEKEGYEVQLEWVSSSSHLANTIIAQSPSADERRVIVPGERKCQLSLTVSSGENIISLENYSGLDHREAMIRMNQLGLNVKTVKQINSSVKEGCIINTFPSAGTKITADTLITVYVSDGSGGAYVNVPDFKNMNSVELELALIKYSLLAGSFSYSYSDTVESGRVISQSVYPGTAVPSGVTAVDFVISLGAKQTDPPIDPVSGTQPPINPTP